MAYYVPADYLIQKSSGGWLQSHSIVCHVIEPTYHFINLSGTRALKERQLYSFIVELKAPKRLKIKPIAVTALVTSAARLAPECESVTSSGGSVESGDELVSMSSSVMAVTEESEFEVELVEFSDGKVEDVVEWLPPSLYIVVVVAKDPESEGNSLESSGGMVEAVIERLPSSLYIVVVVAKDPESEGDSVESSGGVVEGGTELLLLPESITGAAKV